MAIYQPKVFYMLQVSVCIGNACQLKGSYQIIEEFRALIEKHRLEGQVELRESYCQGHCRRGVSVKIGSEYVVNFNTSNIEVMFDEYILNRIENDVN